MVIKELHDMGVSYDEAFESFQQKIEDARRAWAASILTAYPFKPELEAVADALRQDLKANEVEVNSVSTEKLTTVAKSPASDLVRSQLRIVPVRSSLCVLSVGAGEPEQVSDIKHDPFMLGHPAQNMPGIGSWCSVPLKVAGTDAGTICAIQDQSRVWGDRERELLEEVADRIGQLVTDWAASAHLSQLL